MSGLAKKIIIVVVALVVIIAVIAGVLIGASYYGWKAALRSGNEAAAVHDLKTIAAVEVQYFNLHNRTFGTFEQMTKEEMLDARFSANPPTVDGYIFILKVIPKTTNQVSSYTLNSDPESYQTGRKHFYLDSTDGAIHVNADRPASNTDPLFGP